MDWHETFDDFDNSEWELIAPYTDETFYFRLRQRLENNRRVWYSASDAELGGDMDGATWHTFVQARAAIEKCYRNCLSEP